MMNKKQAWSVVYEAAMNWAEGSETEQSRAIVEALEVLEEQGK